MGQGLSFFDANCMIGRVQQRQPVTITTVEELIAEMDYFGIDRALVASAEAAERWIDGGNQALLEKIKPHPRLQPAWVIPVHTAIDYPRPAETVADMLSKGVRAVRVDAAAYHGYEVSEWALGPLWRELAAHRVPVLIGGSDLARYPDQPRKGFSAQNIYDICQRYTDLPVVILRLNFSATRLIVPLLQACKNLYVEISYYTSHRGVEYLARQVGAERILFGSGLPWGSPGPGMVATLYADLSDSERQLVAGGNLERLLESVR